MSKSKRSADKIELAPEIKKTATNEGRAGKKKVASEPPFRTVQVEDFWKKKNSLTRGNKAGKSKSAA